MTELVDTNVYVGQWPFRRLPIESSADLVARLKSRGVTQAWAGTFEGLLHRDLAGANARLVETCQRHGAGLLVPFGSVNPALPDWEEDLRRCHEVHKMSGIRLHPNYHGYKLDDPRAARLLELAADRGLLVQLVVSMEDERTQHSLVRVPHVDCAPLAGLMKQHARLRLVVLNAFRALSPQQAADVVDAAPRRVAFDIAMLEGVGAVARLVDKLGLEHVVFGSLAPLFYFESAKLKLRESELAGAQIEAITAANAARLLANPT